MKKLINALFSLKENQVYNVINKRVKEFEENGKSPKKIFSELCFCFLTANFQAERSIKMQKKLEKDFFEAEEKELARKLKEEGHRFWPQRAEFIVLAREKRREIFKVIKNKNGKEVRDWFVHNIKGLGMKEASHFLRNIGFKDVAIIDFHIVDLLFKNRLIKRPKSLTKKRYLEIEKILEKLGKESGLNLAELDLYLWYLETGKVLK
ncbi:MAG: N-glycosylase/DNA lyase [Candidatus Pacearchaeota archaeon]